MPQVSEIVDGNLESGFLSAHGNLTFKKIATELKNKKTSSILNHFHRTFFQDPIEWEAVKDNVWDSEEKKEKNKFPFMQGDIIQTTSVVSFGQSRSHQQNDLWIVCSPTCDLARGPEYIRVAKVFRIDKSDTNSKKNETKEYEEYMKLVYAAKFASNKYFPLPPFPKDIPDIFGYYVDLVTPYYLERVNIPLAIPKYSLKLMAWHIFNMFLMQDQTRSNPEDEPKIRCSVEGICEPNIKDFQVRIYHGEEDASFYVLANHFSGQSHRTDLQDGEEFTGNWVKISSSQEVYWFAKNGLDIKRVFAKFRS